MRLIESLATTEALSEIFSDASVLQAMLDFEAALARAEARAGVIPEPAAQAIFDAARAESFDAAQIAKRGQRAGTLAIPLVQALTDRVRETDSRSAGFVHWGATSQDVTDTAMALLLTLARDAFSATHMQLIQSLHRLSDEHAGAVMLGRTLLQSAPPVTFGLKAAGWFGAVQRAWSHVDAAFRDACVLQFGGASGTLAALGDQGIAVTRALAEELQLRYPTAPWHTHRDRLATLVTACGVYGATLGKIGRDIALLMQDEIAEAFEPGADGRGESSTMPHKRNPTACSLTVAAATRIPGLVASFLAGMMQEHERGVGGGQAEWATLTELIGATGLALESMAEVAKGLRVDARRMRANIDASRGMVFAERAMMTLAGTLGRDTAHRLLEKAVLRAWDEGCTLREALAKIPEASAAISTGKLDDLDSPQAYLGCAEIFRQQLLRFRKTCPS